MLGVKPIFAIVLILTFFVGNATPAQQKITSDNSPAAQKLMKRLSYLNDIKEIIWVKIDGNSVYVGWKKVPNDIAMVSGGIAFHGNREINFGVHVYNYISERHPTTDGNFFCTSSARHGKVANNTCR